MSIALEDLQIAKPCSADWATMSGDERVRHCGMCKLNVYNVSDMRREDAEALIQNREGHTCLRMFKREDGTVITKDCPVGLRRVRQRMAILAGGLAASIFLAAGSVLARMRFRENLGATPAKAVNQWVNPPTPIPPSASMKMGDICPPRVNTAPVPAPAPAASTPSPTPSTATTNPN